MSSAPIAPVSIAPWWGDLNRATADGVVTQTEVKKLIAPHKDRFDDSGLYGEKVRSLLSDGSPVTLTPCARNELEALLKKDEPQIWWPSNDQLKNIYGNIAESAFTNGRATKLDKAPEGVDNAPSWDITPEGLMDVSKTVYLIEGQLYLRQSGFGPEGVTSKWYSVGPAPLF